jgi:glutamate racemase
MLYGPFAHLLLAGLLTAVGGRGVVTIAVTDSGLGGLSVVAEAERRLRTGAIGGDVELVFYNALFDAESGYNSLPARADKVRIFDRALQGLLADCRPDLVLVACNTLSVLYPETACAAAAPAPVVDIVAGGVDLIASRLPANAPGTVILFGTETTIAEGAHRAALTARGVRPDRIVTQACPQLASYIETGFDSAETAFLIDAYVGEAVAAAGPIEQPLFVSLNCTHYGYALPAWRAAFAARDLAVAEFLDPNLTLADALPPCASTEGGRVRVRVVSMVVIPPATIDSIARWLQNVSPTTATALRNYEQRPDLFAWRDLLPPGTGR